MAFGAVDPAAVQSWERQGKESFYGGNFPQSPLRPLALHGPKASGLSGEPRVQPGAFWCLCCAQEVERRISIQLFQYFSHMKTQGLRSNANF